MSETSHDDMASLSILDRAFDVLFEVGPLGVVRTDASFRVERANKHFCDLLGYSEEELKQMTFPEFTHPDDVDGNVDLARRAVAGDISHYTIEKRYIAKSGETVWVRLTATFIRDAEDSPLSGYALIEDITERRESEEQIRALNAELEARVAELEASNKELETFSSNVSHDLQGPLVSIGQFSQILLNRDRGDLTDSQDELVRRIRNAGLQAKNIIDDLRDLADVTRREIFAEEIDLSAMTWSIIEDLRILAPERDVTFEIRPDLRAYGDPAMVRLLMVNLLQNAWKYSARQDKAVIEVGVEEGPVRKVFFVRDDGIGFPNEHRERIFEAFERLHPRDYAGTGLGLATARRIVVRHGGDIWADGTPNEGATFYFSLK